MSDINLNAGKSVDEKLDRSSIKFNQGSIVVLVSIAFLLNLYWVVALVSIVMLIGTLFPKAGLFKLIYFNVVKPLGIIKSRIVKESNTPHLFAQGMGGVVLAVAYLLLNFTDQNFIAWFLSLAVVALAFINLTTNFCAGCFIYYQLNKIGVFSGYSGKQHV